MSNRLSAAILFTFLFAAAAQAVPTNYQITTDSPQTPVKFLDEFEVVYHIPERMTVIGAVTNYPFGDFSVGITISKVTPDSITAKVKSYEIADFIVPPILVTAVVSNGSTNLFLTPPVLVHAVPTNTTNQLAPIEDIYNIRDWKWLIWLGLALVAAGGIFFLISRLAALHKKRLEEIANSIDPFEQMQAALEELSKWEVGAENYKEYFVRVSEAVRRFIERVLKFNALELATSEIRNALGKMDTTDEVREVVNYILKTCDRVKYAKHQPTADQIREVLFESRNLYNVLAAIYKTPDEPSEQTPGQGGSGGEA